MYIDNDEYNYSLCIAEKSKKEDKLVFYRIADLDVGRKSLERAYYTELSDMDYLEYMPLLIFSKPTDLVEHGVQIRKWKWDAENQKQWSYVDNDWTIFEIFFCDELNLKYSIPINKIQDVFSKGIKIDSYVQDPFLLPINDYGDYYEMLLCKKSDFQIKNGLYCISDTVTDMLHAKHTFLKYKVLKKDMINTKVVKDAYYTVDFEVFEKTRWFYAKTELKSPLSKFTLRNANAYITTLLRWYLKKQNSKNNFTNKEISRTVSVLDEVKESDEVLNEFFMDIEMDIDEVKALLQNHSKRVIDFFESRDDIDDVLTKILLNNPVIYENFVSVAETKWLEENSTMRAQKESELATLEQQFQEKQENVYNLQKQLSNLNEEIDKRESEYLALGEESYARLENIKNETKEAQLKKELIEKEINQSLKSFKEDIVQTTKLMGVVESVQDEQVYAKSHSARLYESLIIIEPEARERSVEEIEEVDDFLEGILDNFEIYFEDYTEIVGTIISAVLSSRVLIISDNISANIVNSCATMIDGCPALILDLSAGKSALVEAEAVLNSCKSNVVYIKGVLDNYDEVSFLSLCRHAADKAVFFGVSSLEKLKLMSQSIFNYALVLDIEDSLDFATNAELTYGKFNLKNIDLPLDKKLIKEYHTKYLKKLVKEKILGANNALILARMLGYYFLITDSREEKLGEILQNTLKSAFVFSDVSDEKTKQLLNSCGFDVDEK